MEKNWRSNAHILPQTPTNTPIVGQHSNQKVKIEEMEISDDANTKQGTSPLLTSLLKSPSAAPNPSPSMLHNLPNQSRVAAPTITNLLTGTVPNLTRKYQYKQKHVKYCKFLNFFSFKFKISTLL